jgi:hypothetical protein
MGDAVVVSGLGPGDDDVVPFFLKPEDRIHRVHNLGSVADREKNFVRHATSSMRGPVHHASSPNPAIEGPWTGLAGAV